MFGVYEGGGAATVLRLCNDLQRQCGLARCLRTEDLDDAAPGDAADAKRVVDAD